MLGQIVTAVSAHYWFRNNEPTIASATASLAVLPLVAPLVGSASKSHSRSDSAVSFISEYLVFYVALAVSITLYRLSPFHPLARYPGPVLCKVTKWTTALISSAGGYHTYVKHLHDTYGPIVRIGPNELSIIEKEAVVPVLGTQGMPRGPMWDGRRFRQAGNTKPYDSLIDVRDNKIHHALRKDWNTAFSAGAVQDYLQLLEARLRQFRDALQNDMAASKDSGAHCVDLRKWITHFATDVMGDLAYGGCFELMREGDVEGFRAVLDEGLVLPSIMQHIPWIAPMILSIPFVASKMRVFAAYGIKYSTLRKATPPKKKDLFYHLYEGSGERTTTRTEAELMRIIVSDSLLTLVAGSDTTATTLCAVLCFILSDRRVYEKLRAELDDAFPEGTGDDSRPEIVFDRLPRLAYLNAVINEGLRLVPAVPTNIQRAPEAGSGGKILGDTQIFVSEGTAVIIPTFTLHRDPRYFSPQPNHFIPERWLSNQATKDGTVYVTDREAFIPFSYGPANCAGKVFAMAELRCVIAMLVRSFDMHHLVGPGSDDPAVLEEKARLWMNGLKDRLVFERPGFRVYMAVRKSVN